MTLYVASNNGSLLLSCATMLALGLIQPHIRLDYLPPTANLITSSDDHPMKIKSQVNVYVSKKESTMSNQQGLVYKLITSKDQFLQAYSDVFDGIGHFPGPPHHIQVDPSITPNQTPSQPVPVHLKEPFKQEIDKMLQAGVLKPIHQAKPWVNSFVLVEGKNKLGKLKHVIIIADDIIIVRYKSDHSDYDQAFTSLLQTALKCNVKLNYNKLQYKQDEVEFFGETSITSGHSQVR